MAAKNNIKLFKAFKYSLKFLEGKVRLALEGRDRYTAGGEINYAKL